MDFTTVMLRRLLEAFKEAGYQFLTVRDACREVIAGPSVILRHDIDRREDKASEIAELESRAGVIGTYYFRCRGVFNREVILKVADLGHEIGYHYENLSDRRGDVTAALADFEQKLAQLRLLADVHTIAMHGAPLSRFDNRALWHNQDFLRYGLAGEAYLSIDFSKVRYLTDTGRCWNAGATNLRDRAVSASLAPPADPPHSTADLIDQVLSQRHRQMYITCHPERWASGVPEWLAIYCKDAAVNLVKRALRLLKR